jgi:prepilin-type N-terminal cleavage/methylation domain-containing protein
MKHKGFTLVELLIVIVVIGILASIGVVSFNGSQLRGRNAARLSSIDQAQEMVDVLLTKVTAADIKATLNLESTNYWNACIGTGYSNVDGDGITDCASYNGSAYASTSSAFNTLLSNNTGPLPDFGKSYPASKSKDGDLVAGPYIQTMTVDSVVRLGIEFSLEGEKTPCIMTPLVYGYSPSATLTKPSGDAANYSSYGNGVTECRFVVADL